MEILQKKSLKNVQKNYAAWLNIFLNLHLKGPKKNILQKNMIKLPLYVKFNKINYVNYL